MINKEANVETKEKKEKEESYSSFSSTVKHPPGRKPEASSAEATVRTTVPPCRPRNKPPPMGEQHLKTPTSSQRHHPEETASGKCVRRPHSHNNRSNTTRITPLCHRFILIQNRSKRSSTLQSDNTPPVISSCHSDRVIVFNLT